MTEIKKSGIREWIEVFIFAVVLALTVQTFVVKPFKIPSGSMENTLQVGDMIFVNRFIYWFTEPKRGDIVVFKYPENPKQDFIKRIIGLPGETIEIKDQQVYINGKPISEPYIKEPTFTDFGPITVPNDSYFVLGDNRNNSRDSRYWGFLNKEMIKGKAFLIYWYTKNRDKTPVPIWRIFRFHLVN